MVFDPQCIPCIINQAYNAAKLFTNGNKELQLKIVKQACSEVDSISGNYTAPLFSAKIQSVIENNLGLVNPYEIIKEKNYKNAEEYLPVLNGILEKTNDKLKTAIKIAIMGNIIDPAANPDYNIKQEIQKLLADEIVLTHFGQFKIDYTSATSILYIGDNFEEALFDQYLLKMLSDKNLVFAVRSRPVLNDITLEDAYRLNMNNICKVIEIGSTIAGTDIQNCSREFLELFNKADMVIAKGQGNYETLLDEKRPIYFLFKVKCDVISRRSGLPAGHSVLFYKGKS